MPERTAFVPFDPATKRSEAFFSGDGLTRVVKGSPLPSPQWSGM